MIYFYIRKVNGKYTVFSESGKHMGSYSSKAEALRRLRSIEYWKKHNK